MVSPQLVDDATSLPDAGDYDTDVFIVGVGPAGASAALALARLGIRVRAISKWNWVSNGPRAHITNQRTMEVLRDLEVEGEALKHALPWALMGDTLFCTSLTGTEIARIPSWGTGDDVATEYAAASPSPMADIPQSFLEPVLVDAAAAAGAQIRFNTSYVAHVEHKGGVDITIEDRIDGHVSTVRARYLIGADGGRSQVLENTGIELDGTLGRAGTVYAQFRGDLSHLVAHRPADLYRFVSAEPAYGDIGMSTMRVIRPWHTWIAGWGFDASTEPELSEEFALAKIRSLVGDPGFTPEITAISTWYVNEAVARTYQRGRVFLAGDAVHRHPPSGGLGSNTCIQDAYNLAWKLAYAITGAAGPGLLETYTAERRPVGVGVVARANQSRYDYAPFTAALGLDKRDGGARVIETLADPSAEGRERREALGRAMQIKNLEFNAHGIEMNLRYESAAVIPDPSLGDEEWEVDPELRLQPTTRPGAMLPHAWLIDDKGRRISTLDVVGRGRFTLLTGLSGRSWAEAAASLGHPYLHTVVIGDPNAVDVYRAWQRRSEIREDGALLIRPDRVVAWRAACLAEDPADVLRTVLDSVLDRVMLPQVLVRPPNVARRGLLHE